MQRTLTRPLIVAEKAAFGPPFLLPRRVATQQPRNLATRQLLLI